MVRVMIRNKGRTLHAAVMFKKPDLLAAVNKWHTHVSMALFGQATIVKTKQNGSPIHTNYFHFFSVFYSNRSNWCFL